MDSMHSRLVQIRFQNNRIGQYAEMFKIVMEIAVTIYNWSNSLSWHVMRSNNVCKHLPLVVWDVDILW